MSEHLVAARAALADLIAHHQTQIDRARAALAALDTDVVPLVRPPTPDVIDPPVVLPKPPKREQQPAPAAAKEQANRAISATLRERAKETVTCPECGKTVSRVGIGTHRRMAHKVTAATAAKEAEHNRLVEQAATQETYKCATCTAVFTEKSKLANHTITNHGRGPTSAENTPITSETAA